VQVHHRKDLNFPTLHPEDHGIRELADLHFAKHAIEAAVKFGLSPRPQDGLRQCFCKESSLIRIVLLDSSGGFDGLPVGGGVKAERQHFSNRPQALQKILPIHQFHFALVDLKGSLRDYIPPLHGDTILVKSVPDHFKLIPGDLGGDRPSLGVRKNLVIDDHVSIVAYRPLPIQRFQRSE
jgi:hypothetical protein